MPKEEIIYRRLQNELEKKVDSFTACYGTKPCDYREEMADSLSVAFRNAASDSIGVNQQPAVSASDGTTEVRR